jgi:hypothetical protein
MASIRAATDSAANQTAMRTGLVLDMIVNLRRGKAFQARPCSVATAWHAKKWALEKALALATYST